jgi:uncharacterized repeat protein (TIGR01451 family)
MQYVALMRSWSRTCSTLVVGLTLAAGTVGARAASADLVVTLGTTGQTAGAPINFFATVANNGPDDAQNVTISLPAPSGTTFESAVETLGPPFSCSLPPVGSTGTVTCSIPVLATGVGAAFTISFHVVDTTNKLVTLTATSTTPDPTPSNNAITIGPPIAYVPLEVTTHGPQNSGLVQSSPEPQDAGGLNCQVVAQCDVTYLTDQAVLFNAAAAPGFVFTGWSGACSGTAPCIVNMNAVLSVDATFAVAPAPVELTIAPSGSGPSGIVTSSPTGILCAPTCASGYVAGDVVTLTATDHDRAVFIGWAGPCAGSGSCTVALNADTTVFAEFALVPSLLGPIDFDGDGRADLLFTTSGPHAYVGMLMNGTQVVDQAYLYNLPSTGGMTHAADFDGDGRTDLVWHDSVTGETVLFPMNGLNLPIGRVVLADPAWRVTLTGDFDGDGKADLVWRNDVTGETAVWLMDGLVMKSGAVVMTDGRWRAAYVADFNGDGKADLVWRNDVTGETALWIMNGTAFTSGGTVLADPAWSVIATGDFDGDGKADLVWHNVTTGETSVWLMNGATYVSGAIVLTNHAWGVTHVADLDGDGRSDLILHNGSTGETALWLMNGTARGAAVKLTGTEDYDVLRTADLNGDGKADLIWRNRVDGITKVWLMDGITRIDFSPAPLAGFNLFPL